MPGISVQPPWTFPHFAVLDTGSEMDLIGIICHEVMQGNHNIDVGDKSQYSLCHYLQIKIINIVFWIRIPHIPPIPPLFHNF